MNLSNRAFQLSTTDSFGYDVHRTDPLYKHIPLLINATPEGCVATFSTSRSRGFYSVGCEMDGLWGPYKYYRQDYDGLEEYLIVGRTLREVVKTYADLIGYPLLVPRWAFGYIAGGMKYSMLDSPPAVDALMELAEKFKKHDIPCSGFQLSSGYTVAETEPKTRNVFTWNRHRFPDPAAFFAAYRKQGIRVIANVKPYVLTNHPEYQRLAEARALFTDPRKSSTAQSRLWSVGGGESGVGSHIDFTSEAGFAWWYTNIRALRQVGVELPWNDNHEYIMPDDNWLCKLDIPLLKADEKQRRDARVGLWGRALNCELMGKSSHDALVDLEPDRRPFVLTRSATPGTLRYCASSWSGDNVTNWSSMKGSTALSLTAGMCLMQCYGHDIGGFEGPQPSPELLLRWVHSGCYSQRFAINCYKTNKADNKVGDVIEPWTYPDILPGVRRALKRRYEMIPYLYSLALESHLIACPPQRWVGWGYEEDPEVWTETLLDGETQYWLGDALLFGGVFEPGATSARMYLPRRDEHDPGYVNVNPPYQHFEAGQWVDVEAVWYGSGIPVLAKVGSAIPVGKNVQVQSPGETDGNPADLPEDDYRGVEIFPPKGASGRTFETSWLEDDGIAAQPAISRFIVRYESTEEKITAAFEADRTNKWKPLWEDLDIVLPVGDARNVTSQSETGVTLVEQRETGQRVWRLKAIW
ncbi:hypothetical protein LTS18_007021 [Coniosporium uncinatum]|uniref:Uncharacterized protein n=1 Tax=Coniosporium uncinatum TaxID=93489 RepID=A0ACC3DB09_9PEZI|nr:hypothetical protein LTS18_007021 [Coniosporium uncinatum]